MDVGKALIDLGSSVNLIPLSIIRRICDLDMKNTRMTLQLADKSITKPFGISEDALVKVDKFLFPIDFIVMDIEEDDDVPLILGRTFLKTARMIIDIDNGLMKVSVQDEEANFNLFEAMKHSKDTETCFKIDAMDEAILDVQKQAHITTPLERALTNALNVLNLEEEKEIKDCLKELDTTKEIPLEGEIVEELKEESIQEHHKFELNFLPDHLKYVFLEEGGSKLVIISNSLASHEEKKLIQVFKENQQAIGYVQSDLKGISPSYCMHKIVME